MIDILREQALSDHIVEILETDVLEVTIVLNGEAGLIQIATLIRKINTNRASFYSDYSIIYVYDNGRVIDL